ncbi:uncharacterized protein LOC114724318 [Neltuma alba]|uniref:uncharacterized protein LOC114724318 n=1 Tax=Neltuma alba TaxID=207710 RepID=UPI0010A59FCC|nr:uncharacterized protein LOC114724318 [Prosopis alba]XP_028766483.1 uncharacterized protein LOC114724318 [Prosopis alba]XP_028766484.1 uncharacterized protein LOC114724318 [Prosopis alba]XP_028766485.1 uncharacterized protein LOC114724318 [Prosopis alba]XP_028766486.1 uncharacterized protein LOC114724318 [Prosopis alba]XP_028766487.1 uncharacterized protein LOC114724318 [Prosopis alba]
MPEADPKSHSSSPAPSSSSSNGVPSEIRSGHSNNHGSNQFSGHKAHYPNPPDAVNPDAATLRDQWRYAIKQYSRWYSHAWGTAILAGAAFFALGWVIKGGNPLPSFRAEESSPTSSSDSEKPR